MQLDARIHFYKIVVPLIDAYDRAEIELSRAIADKHEPDAQDNAQFSALRHGGAAAVFLHHFSDVVACRPPDNLPDFKCDVGAARKWLSEVSKKKLGSSEVEILTDIADALKHAVLIHKLPREVEAAGQVLVVSRGYGTARYGEGKHGGVDEVWVIGRSEKRPLSSVLSSVKRVWEGVLAV